MEARLKAENDQLKQQLAKKDEIIKQQDKMIVNLHNQIDLLKKPKGNKR